MSRNAKAQATSRKPEADEAYKQLRRHVRQSVALIDRLHDLYDSLPATGSVAAAEFATQSEFRHDWGNEPV